jgi:hypothetical protein
MEVLKLGEEADKFSNMRDYHVSEQCYLHVLKILPQHVQSLCNYAHLLHTDKKELDKSEELSKKTLQAELHRAPTLFNHRFQDAEDVRSFNDDIARSEPQLVQINDDQPICLLYAKHGQCRFGHKCKFKHVHKELSAPRSAMPTSTLPTSSISFIHNNIREIYTSTPVQSTFSQEQLEKV